MPDELGPKPFTVEQAAQLLGCSDKTIRDSARTGRLAGCKFGDDWVFPRGAFFVRLDEVALEEARQRREPDAPRATVHTIQPAQPGAARRGARRRPLPALPSV